MKISDIIENFLKELIEEENGEAVFQRNELASRLNCVPSQINYVINSRFTNDHGYIVESRRGGAGYIKLTRTAPENESLVLHIIGAIGDNITSASSNAVIKELYAAELITQKEAKIIMAALSDSSLIIRRPERDVVRAKMLKNILINLV